MINEIIEKSSKNIQISESSPFCRAQKNYQKLLIQWNLISNYENFIYP